MEGQSIQKADGSSDGLLLSRSQIEFAERMSGLIPRPKVTKEAKDKK